MMHQACKASMNAVVTGARSAARCRRTGLLPADALKAMLMKRVAVWAFYAVSVLAILYLALNVYAAFRRPSLTPGEPIHIFRSPDGPSYS